MSRRSSNSSNRGPQAAVAGGSRSIEAASPEVAESLTAGARLLRFLTNPLVCLVLIAIAAVAVYANSFSGTFILDDEIWIRDNASIRHLWPIDEVLFPADAGMVGGRPIVSLTFAINYALGGTNPWGYHALNLAIHVLAAWTLFGLIRRTLSLPSLAERFGSAAMPLALAATLIWTVHPLQTAAVTYIVQRTESLVALFYLLTLYCVLRGTTTSRSRGWSVAAAVACLAGMATKEVMVTAPVLVLLYDRTFLAGSFGGAFRKRWGLYLALAATWCVVPWVLIATGFHGGSAGFSVAEFTWWTYLRTQPGVIVHYLQLALLPMGLCLDFKWPAANSVGEIVPAGLFVVALLASTIWLLVRHPKIGFLAASFFLILAPTSSFVPLRDAAFDHRMYLPLAGLAVLFVLGLFALCERRRAPIGRAARRQRRTPVGSILLAVVLVTAVVVAFGGLTVARNKLFASGTAMWEDVLAKSPDNARAHVNLADLLSQQGRLDEAIRHNRRALEIHPDFAEAECNLALNLLNKGNNDEAVEHFAKAVDLNPTSAQMRLNYASGLFRQGKLDEAIAQCEKARDLNPDLVEVYYDLAAFLASQGKLDEAIAQSRAALKIDPNSAAAHYNLAGIYVRQNKPDDAIAECREAVRLQPNMADAHLNLGNLLCQRGHWREGIAQMLTAQRLQPNHVMILNQLARALATCPEGSLRNGVQAIALAQQAAQLTNGQDPNVLDTLAAAEAEAGRFNTAIRVANQALALAAAQKNSVLVEGIQERIKLYEAGLAFHDRRLP